MSKMRPEHIYTKKVVTAAVSFVSVIVVMIAACTLGRDFAKNSTSQLSLMGGDVRTEEQQERMSVMDEIFFKGNGDFTDDELMLLVKSYLPELSDMQIHDEMKRMRDKYDMWSGIYFKFYYIWIALAVGIIGYFIPNLVMLVRAYFIKTETEDDFMQLQTLTSILIYTGIDTMEILRQMVRHSTVHQDALRIAYHGFSAAPELELERLRTKVTIPEFKVFIDKLRLTISELSMDESFSDLISEREYFLRLRMMAMQATVQKKKLICSVLSFMPLVLYAVSEFVLPILILGITEFSGSMAML